MAYLTVNGVEVRCYEGASKSNVYVGPTGDRSFAGTFRGAARATRREWTCTTAPMSTAESVATQGLIEGTGQRMPLNTDAFSAAGLATTTAVNEASFGAVGGHPHSPFRMVQLYNGRATWAIAPATTWTILASAIETGTTARHLVLTSSGGQFMNGASAPAYDVVGQFTFSGSTLTWSSKVFGGANWAATSARALNAKMLASGQGFVCIQAGTTGAAQPTWPTTYGATVADGTVIWRNTGANGYSAAGEIVWLPYVVPDTWVPALYNFHSTTVWASNPAITCGGTFNNGVVLTCLGTVKSVRFVDFMSGGVLVSGQVIEFTLREV